MQIVIEISEELYNDIQSRDWKNGELVFGEERKAIHNGTPLPKGHGDLKDADVLCDYFWDNRSKLYTHKDLRIVIDNAPTIIASDKESEL